MLIIRNGSWGNNNAANRAINLSDTDEKDYLYFAAEGGGRYVNNGRAKNQTPFDPEQGPKNTDADNPGYLINLDMKHAMAMVSFRVYDGGNLSSNDVKFTKFVIKNHDGSSNSYIKTGNGKMLLSDGTISDNTSTGTLTRNITNYILMKQIKDGVQSDKAFRCGHHSSGRWKYTGRLYRYPACLSVAGRNQLHLYLLSRP